jgi:ABC-type proline/glycine betaine transport system ATPase subunit
MRWSSLQIFSLAIVLSVLTEGMAAPAPYDLEMTDVDQHVLSTADGHLTLIVAARTNQLDKVRTVGDRAPDECLGNPKDQFVTLITFEAEPVTPARMVVDATARHRLDEEGKRLQERYASKKLDRDARQDCHAVLDFDGKIAARLEVPPSAAFQVIVLSGSGQVLGRWDDLPSAEDLAAAMK